MSGQVLIAVDKGTSETKVQAYDLAGKLITQCSEANAIDATEEDLQDVWIITQRLLRQTCEVLRDQNYTPIGLGISAHMGGLILLDGDANPIAPAML